MKKKTTKATKAATTTKKPGKPAPAALASDGQVVAAAPTPKGKPVAVVAKAGKPAPKAKAPKVAKQSPTAAIRAALAADPTLEADAIAAALAKQGMQPPASTVTTVRADFLGCLKALQAAGRVKLH